MKNEELIIQLEKHFNALQKKLGLATTLEELDRAFFIRDAILKDGFVSLWVSRQVRHRIVEAFMNWNEYLHSLVMPNPQNMLNMSESKVFNVDERKEITAVMQKAMELNSRNSLINLSGSDDEDPHFIDDALTLWEKTFKPHLVRMMKRIKEAWGERT